MGQFVWSLFLLFCSSLVLIPSSQGQVLSVNWNIKLNISCDLGLYENDITSQSYKSAAADVNNGIKQMYTGNSDFNKSSVLLFNCVGKNLMVGTVVKVNNITKLELVTFQNVFKNAIALKNTAFKKSVLTYNLTADRLAKITPVLYSKVDGTIAGSYFCKYRADFKKNVAKTLILADGVSTADSAQVILHNHPCGSSETELITNVQFYISQRGMMGKVDIILTTLAYRVVDQMIYDGTAWRLGIHLYKQLDRIELLGSAKQDPGLSDVEIIYAGFGAVLLLILVILLVVWIVDFSLQHCCKGWCGTDEKDFHVTVIESSSNEKSIGISNELFEMEKGPIDEQVEDPLEIKPVQCSPASPSREYVELNNMDSSASDNDMSGQDTYDGIDEPPVKSGEDTYDVIDEPPVKAVSEDVAESVPDLVEVTVDVDPLPPPPPYESEEEDYDDVESDVDEGLELTPDEMLALVSDENSLRIEYEKLGNRVPGAMLYPENVPEKNRNLDCFPWPESRVPLKVDDPNADYINASFVKNNKGAIAYISTQAPMESTTNDFWRMIWERNIEVIVMVTPLNLRRAEMCSQYWPRDQIACSYGDIKVQLQKKELKPDFLVMTVAASLGEAEPRQIYLFRYMSWPQSDIPDSCKSIVAFLLEIREVCDKLHSLPVFHCSSGRGMSAVLIALYNGMITTEESSTVNVKKVVRLLRRDVPGAIETFEQYKFLYEAIYQYALFNAN